MEPIDRQVAHALQIDPRASFAKIAEVLGTSEHTVARRYRKLRDAKAIRVVGWLNGLLLGHHSWTVRLRCTPDAGAPLAAALARRPDTYWVHLLSGGTEISCLNQAGASADLLLDKLPRNNRVLNVSAHAVLRGFVAPTTWSGLACLTNAQVERLRPEPEHEEPGELDDQDRALVELLGHDGRTGYAELAKRVRISESAARRRVEHLRRSGALYFQLDVDPRAFGYLSEARLWMSVHPAKLAEAGQAMATHPEVYFAAATTGATNLVASVACRDQIDLYRYLTERAGALPGVHSLETAPVLRTVKRAGIGQDRAS